jgi:hypothetical protein
MHLVGKISAQISTMLQIDLTCNSGMLPLGPKKAFFRELGFSGESQESILASVLAKT